MEIEAEKYSPYCMDSIQSIRLFYLHRNRGKFLWCFLSGFGMFPKVAIQHLMLCFEL
jgi:hypothetical protein